MRAILLLISILILSTPVLAADEDYPKWARKFMKMYDEEENPKVHEVREIKKNSTGMTGESKAAPMSYGAFPQNNIDSSYIIPWMYNMSGIQRGPAEN